MLQNHQPDVLKQVQVRPESFSCNLYLAGDLRLLLMRTSGINWDHLDMLN